MEPVLKRRLDLRQLVASTGAWDYQRLVREKVRDETKITVEMEPYVQTIKWSITARWPWFRGSTLRLIISTIIDEIDYRDRMVERLGDELGSHAASRACSAEAYRKLIRQCAAEPTRLLNEICRQTIVDGLPHRVTQFDVDGRVIVTPILRSREQWLITLERLKTGPIRLTHPVDPIHRFQPKKKWGFYPVYFANKNSAHMAAVVCDEKNRRAYLFDPNGNHRFFEKGFDTKTSGYPNRSMTSRLVARPFRDWGYAITRLRHPPLNTTPKYRIHDFDRGLCAPWVYVFCHLLATTELTPKQAIERLFSLELADRIRFIYSYTVSIYSARAGRRPL